VEVVGGGRGLLLLETGVVSGTEVDEDVAEDGATDGIKVEVGVTGGPLEVLPPPFPSPDLETVSGPGVETPMPPKDVEDVLFLALAAVEKLDSIISSSNFFLLMDRLELLR